VRDSGVVVDKELDRVAPKEVGKTETKIVAKIVVYTLGCKTNQSESGSLITALKVAGCVVTSKLERADVYILNSCSVTDSAHKKSKQMLSKFKALNESAKIIVIGCAPEYDAGAFCGADFVQGVRSSREVLHYLGLDNITTANCAPTTDRIKTYIKIQDGCDNACAYCIVPKLRGKSVSKPLSDIIAQIKGLAGKPNSEPITNPLAKPIAKPIVLTGINVLDYKYNQKTIIDVITQINKLGNPFEIGSLYIDKTDVTLIEALSKAENFVPIFHLSIQSMADNVLKNMGRDYSVSDVFAVVANLRQAFSNNPAFRLSADIIAGFPQESESEHTTSYQNLKKLNLNHLHIFPYSVRKGTRAEIMEQVPKDIIKQRAKQLSMLNVKC